MNDKGKIVALPVDFLEMVGGVESGLAVALDGDASVSVRLNPSKQCCGGPIFSHSVGVAWCAEGRYLADRPQFTLDPVHWSGGYYVQEASSMIVGAAVERFLDSYFVACGQPLLVVDLCAAPGGKTTHLSSVVGGRGVVVGNEVINQRAGILAQNITRWGEGNCVVTSSDSAVLGTALRGSVDVLVVDAPCSGEGMFRKDMRARQEWTMANVELCAGRSRRILADSVGMLKNGGLLVYSTCTFNPHENEEVVQWLLDSGDWELCNELFDNHGSGLRVGDLEGEKPSSDKGCSAGNDTGLGRHFYPSLSLGEGLYVAALRFIGEAENPAVGGRSDSKKTKKGKNSAHKLNQNAAQTSAQNSDKGGANAHQYSTRPITEIEHGGRLWAYPHGMKETVEALQQGRVQILQGGIELGEMIRGSLKPAHSLALYAHLPAEAFPRTELDHTTALEYLRKNTIDPQTLCEGLQIVTHRGLPLGFIKRIGNRANNLYPTANRIINL